MKIKNQVTLVVSIILISIGTATAQTQSRPSNLNLQIEKLEELEKLQQEQQTKDFIKKEVEEVDRTVGERFERTTSLLDANLSVLNFWLIVSPVLVTVAFVFFRQIVLKEWVSHTKKELEELGIGHGALGIENKKGAIRRILQLFLDNS